MQIAHIFPQKNIRGEVVIPGSKSYTNRALILAALAPGKTYLNGYSTSDDSVALIQGLEKLGIVIEKQQQQLVVFGRGGEFLPYSGEIHVGPAGTAMRFLTSLCCLARGEILLTGSERMHQRPINDLVDALRSLGAEIEYRGKPGCPPLLIRGFRSGVQNQVTMSGRISSQFFTSLLLLASVLPETFTIHVAGEQISKSYIDMTIASLRQFGITVENNCYQSYTVSNGQKLLGNQHIWIEGDASGASYFWALAAISKGDIKVKNISPDSLQGDAKFPKLLQKMGCGYEEGKDETCGWIRIFSKDSLKAIECDMENMPDTAQTLAMVAAIAHGVTCIHGLSTLRHKETDRCLALKTELQKLGIHSEIDDSTLRITGESFRQSTVIETYEDHRMAMSFAILGSMIPEGIKIRNPQVVNKSFPEFWDYLASLGMVIKFTDE